MGKTIPRIIGAMLWAGAWVGSAGAMRATDYETDKNLPTLCEYDPQYLVRSARRGLVFAVLANSIPPGWLVTLMVTGAYQDGWRLDATSPCPEDMGKAHG